jgi:hypothetical protein
VVVVVGCVNENDCGGGGCLELSICECLGGRTDGRSGGGGGGMYNPIKRFKNLLIRLNEKFGEFGGICEETFWLVVPSSQRTVEELTKIEQLKKEPSANPEQRKELEKVKAEKMAELKGLCEQVRLPLPKLLGPSYFDG